ncbi:MAG: hypothetical protein ACI4KR_08630 [Ruminiclostridium sp.]
MLKFGKKENSRQKIFGSKNKGDYIKGSIAGKQYFSAVLPFLKDIGGGRWQDCKKHEKIYKKTKKFFKNTGNLRGNLL